MTWEYALIGLVVGIIIGAVAMRFGNRKLRQQQALQYELEKNKAELDEYREELVSHFARSAELLDTMAHDYRQLYQHMAKSSSSLLPELSAEANPFRNRLAESEASNDQAPVQMPRDYSEADIIMPPLGLLIGGIDFKQFAVTLRDAQGDIPAVVMHYGVFIQNVFDFLIVAFAIFMAIKLINKLNRKKEEPAAAPAPTKEEVLLTEIRDLLKEQNNRS